MHADPRRHVSLQYSSSSLHIPLRLGRDAWSILEQLKKKTNEYAPPNLGPCKPSRLDTKGERCAIGRRRVGYIFDYAPAQHHATDTRAPLFPPRKRPQLPVSQDIPLSGPYLCRWKRSCCLLIYLRLARGSGMVRHRGNRLPKQEAARVLRGPRTRAGRTDGRWWRGRGRVFICC